jgi:hypothetical protein
LVGSWKLPVASITVVSPMATRRQRLDQLLDEELPRYANALERLGESSPDTTTPEDRPIDERRPEAEQPDR